MTTVYISYLQSLKVQIKSKVQLVYYQNYLEFTD